MPICLRSPFSTKGIAFTGFIGTVRFTVIIVIDAIVTNFRITRTTTTTIPTAGQRTGN
jgi:hypothetical protein